MTTARGRPRPSGLNRRPHTKWGIGRTGSGACRGGNAAVCHHCTHVQQGHALQDYTRHHDGRLTDLRVILKCNGEFIYVKLISDIARLRGVVSLSCEERREGGGSHLERREGGGSKAMYPR